jgi:hypothetical protein
MHSYRFLALAALVLAPRVLAVETQTWTQASQADFENGTLKNLSLRSDGRLTLAPVFREIFDPSTAYLWALAHDSKGNLYAGGGGPTADTARLFIVDAAGKGRPLADLPGMEIHAIAVDRDDRVYAATAPDGKVYRVGAGGKYETFYDPKAKYIWAMAFNSKGELFVATGSEGEIHRVTRDGKGSVFFDTEETHARSLAIDTNDNIIAGTEPGGLILRISPAGEGFVLYQAGKREVTAVAVTPAGIIYAAAVGNKSSTPAGSPISSGLQLPITPAPAPAAPNSAAGPARAGNQPMLGAPPPAAPKPLPSVAGGSEVYRIGTDGYPQRIWSHDQDIVYAIAFDGTGAPVVATGNKGNLYRIDSEHAYTLLVNSGPTQVTALGAGRAGRIYAVTGNVGKVFQLGPELEKQGQYESDPLDVGFFSYWGRVRHHGEPNGGKILFETRSGNLDRPQKNWSPWKPIDGNEGRVTSPSARFLQYRATLEAGPGGKSPQLHEVEVAYMAKNVPPAIDAIEITPANYRFPPAPSTPAAAPQTLTLPPLAPQKKRTSSPPAIDVGSSQTLQYMKGHIGARWAASDPNGDGLLYKVEIRGVRENDWKLLRDEVKEKHMSWDATAFSDGEYVLRVTASDAPDNPPGQALTTSLVADPFIIDNTAPQITGLAGTRNGGKLIVRWSARDGRSVIRKAEYSINGGEWMVVEPTTRLSDSPEHQYELALDPGTGEQTVAVRVTDDFENQSVDKIVVR